MPKKRAKSRFRETGRVGETFSDVFPNELAVITTIRKSADEVVNNSDVLQNDDDFFFDVLEGDVWEVVITGLVTSATAADFKYDFSVPTGATVHGIVGSLQVGAAGSGTNDLAASVDLTADDGIGTLGTGTEAAFYIRALVVVAETPGVVNFRWAQNTATASDTTLLAESWMTVRRI